MKKVLAVILIISLLVLPACESKKEVYTMVVPYGAGGTTDVIGRKLASSLEKELNATIVVKNSSGASGAIGCQEVLDAKADGHTLLFCAESLGTQRVMDLSKLSYDDFTPIMAVANDPKVIIVGKDCEYKDIYELLDAIKNNPNKIQMSYTGKGGSGHVQALIMNMFGYYPALTAYSSGGEGILAILSHDMVFTNANYSTVTKYLESGDCKIYAICSNERMAEYPDVPALSEVIKGSDYYMDIPYVPLSLMVSKDVDAKTCEKLREAAQKAVCDKEFDSFMTENHIDKLYEKYKTTDEIKAFYKEWESVVSYLLYDANAASHNPEEFGIARIN